MQQPSMVMATQQEKRHWNAQEVADRLGMHPRTISRHIQAGKLDAIQPGKAYIITRSALVDYLGSEQKVRDLFGPPQGEQLS